MRPDQLRRVRWAVRSILLLGIAVSVFANVLHAEDNLISQGIAAWPPLALLLTVELISRVPVARWWLSAVRLVATAAISGIAAYVSYFHMAAVVSRYGERQPNPYLMPLSVDGLIVVASICLVELGGRIRTAEESTQGGSHGQARAEDQGQGGVREGVVPDGGQGAGEDPEGAPGDVPGRQEEVAAPAQIEPPRPAARKPHTTNPDRVRRVYERNPEADPTKVAKRLNLSLATVKKYRPPKEQPEQVNGKVPDLELEELK
jgi:hypothetical protein